MSTSIYQDLSWAASKGEDRTLEEDVETRAKDWQTTTRMAGVVVEMIEFACSPAIRIEGDSTEAIEAAEDMLRTAGLWVEGAKVYEGPTQAQAELSAEDAENLQSSLEVLEEDEAFAEKVRARAASMARGEPLAFSNRARLNPLAPAFAPPSPPIPGPEETVPKTRLGRSTPAMSAKSLQSSLASPGGGGGSRKARDDNRAERLRELADEVCRLGDTVAALTVDNSRLRTDYEHSLEVITSLLSRISTLERAIAGPSATPGGAAAGVRQPPVGAATAPIVPGGIKKKRQVY